VNLRVGSRTQSCNSNCIDCANATIGRKKEFMDMKVFKKSVDKYTAMGGHFLKCSHTTGDWLIDGELMQRARYVKEG
jgi:hypothetical protein